MISLSLLDIGQLGAAVLATICLLVLYLRVKKPDSKDSTIGFQRTVSILSWILIGFIAIDLGWLGGRWLGESQKPIKILSPTAGQAVDLRIFVTGRASIIPEGQELWVVVSPQGSGQFIPAASRAVIQTGGDWSSLVFIGSENNHGLKVDLLAVLVDASAAATFRENSQVGLQTLPSGCLVVDQVTISRK